MKRGIPLIILGLFFLFLSDCSDMLNDLLHPGGSGRIYSSETSCILDGTGETGAFCVDTDGDYMYMGGAGPGKYLYRVSIADNSLIGTPLPALVFRLIVVGDYIWTCSRTVFQKVNRHTMAVEWSDAATAVDSRSFAFDGTYVWAADRGTNLLYRINPATNELTSYAGIVQNGSRYMRFINGYLWVTCSDSNSVVKINPVDRTFTVIPGITGAWGVCYDGADVFAAGMAGWLYKIDPSGATVVDSSLISGCAWLCDAVFDGTRVWCADNGLDDVKIIDPATLAVLDTRSTPAMPHMACFDGKYVWVANESSTTVVKLLY
ncbi:MAG: hypothetical protein JXD23_13900 [Spirochaetales bacterium]|nr:hypothetical protein [Spirochaetales bacterium]